MTLHGGAASLWEDTQDRVTDSVSGVSGQIDRNVSAPDVDVSAPELQAPNVDLGGPVDTPDLEAPSLEQVHDGVTSPLETIREDSREWARENPEKAAQHRQADGILDRAATTYDYALDHHEFSVHEGAQNLMKRRIAQNDANDINSYTEVSDEQLRQEAERSWQDAVADPVASTFEERTGLDTDEGLTGTAVQWGINEPVRGMSRTFTGIDPQDADNTGALTGNEILESTFGIMGGGATTTGVKGALRGTRFAAGAGTSAAREGAERAPGAFARLRDTFSNLNLPSAESSAPEVTQASMAVPTGLLSEGVERGSRAVGDFGQRIIDGSRGPARPDLGSLWSSSPSSGSAPDPTAGGGSSPLGNPAEDVAPRGELARLPDSMRSQQVDTPARQNLRETVRDPDVSPNAAEMENPSALPGNINDMVDDAPSSSREIFNAADDLADDLAALGGRQQEARGSQLGLQTEGESAGFPGVGGLSEAAPNLSGAAPDLGGLSRRIGETIDSLGAAISRSGDDAPNAGRFADDEADQIADDMAAAFGDETDSASRSLFDGIDELTDDLAATFRRGGDENPNAGRFDYGTERQIDEDVGALHTAFRQTDEAGGRSSPVTRNVEPEGRQSPVTRNADPDGPSTTPTPDEGSDRFLGWLRRGPFNPDADNLPSRIIDRLPGGSFSAGALITGGAAAILLSDVDREDINPFSGDEPGRIEADDWYAIIDKQYNSELGGGRYAVFTQDDEFQGYAVIIGTYDGQYVVLRGSPDRPHTRPADVGERELSEAQNRGQEVAQSAVQTGQTDFLPEDSATREQADRYAGQEGIW